MKNITLLLLLIVSQLVQSQVTANQPNPLTKCDINNDGFATFNLTDAEADIIGSQTNVQVTYHLTQGDADNGTNQLSPANFGNTLPYTQIVYVRVEDIFTGDYATTTLDLIVEPLPATTTPSPIVLIDSNGDGYEVFDLTIRESNILTPSPDIDFYYFETLTDANSGTNPIANPTAYQNIITPQQTIYVRVEFVDTGCYSIEPLDIILDEPVTANDPDPLIACDFNNNGFATFDLTEADADIIGSQTNVQVTYHETLFDAEQGDFPILQNYQNIVQNQQTLYSRVEGMVNSNFVIVELLLVVEPLPVTTTPAPIEIIDEDGNGHEIFDLTIRENDIADTTQNIVFSYFETLTDAETNSNPIANPSAYQNTVTPQQTIYVKIEDMDTGCYSIEPMLIIVEEELNHQSYVLNSFNFYPNPAQDYIHFSSAAFNNYGIEIININGQQVYSQNNFLEISKTGTLDISFLTPGIYFLRITTEDKQITHKLIKE